jgi:ATP-dependent Lhr-like helicase
MRFDGADGWCDRRLLARIRRYTLDRLRREIAPVTPADLLRFLGAWQRLSTHVPDARRLEGPAGVAEALRQLAGFEAPVATWERKLLPARVTGYRQEWLDDLVLRGELAWGRLWGSARTAPRSTPVCFLPRDELDRWLALAEPPATDELAWPARATLDALSARGAMFPQDLLRAAKLLPSDAERGLEELVARGVVTADSFASLRQLLRPAHRRREPGPAVGRWSLFRTPHAASGDTDGHAPLADVFAGADERAEFVARALLRRYGVVFRKLLERERLPVPWRDLARCLRRLELRGDVRGGRFVSRFAGEQFALPDAVELLRRVRRDTAAGGAELTVAAADPLNLRGILTPDERVSAASRASVTVLAATTEPVAD